MTTSLISPAKTKVRIRINMKSKNACGACRECCIAYPLRQDPDFWPAGKPAGVPCRHLCASGCAIHALPRPRVCTEFECAYIEKGWGEDWRPDRCGVIVSFPSVLNLFLGTPP